TLEPFRAADGKIGDGGAVLERPGATFECPTRDLLGVENARRPRVAQPARLEAFPRLEPVAQQLRLAHAVEAEAPFAASGAVPRVHRPVRQLALENVRLDAPCRRRLLAFLLVLDLDEPPVADRSRERRDEVLLGVVAVRLGRLYESELAEGLLELLPHALERRVRLGRDHRPDVLEREPDGPGFERRQPRRRAE